MRRIFERIKTPDFLYLLFPSQKIDINLLIFNYLQRVQNWVQMGVQTGYKPKKKR